MTDELSDRAAGWAQRGPSEEDGEAERDGDSESSEHSEPSGISESSTGSENSESSSTSQSAENVRNPDNVKEAWDGNYYYLPPDISSDLEEEMDRLQYECRDLNIKKNRHFNVVMVIDGIESIQDMSGGEFKDRLEELGLL